MYRPLHAIQAGRQCGTYLRLPRVAAHEDELAEPAVDEEGADDADDHHDQDYGPLVEDVCESTTVYLVHSQKEPEVRRQTCIIYDTTYFGGEQKRREPF